MTLSRHATAFAVIVSFSLGVSSGMAQDSPQPPHRAERYHVAAAKTYNMHAHDHARLLGKYAAASGQPVSGKVVGEHAQAIAAHVARAQASYAKLAGAAQSNPAVAKQLAAIEKQLSSVTSEVQKLKSASTDNSAEAKLVLSETAAIAKNLKATHDASKEIEQALNESLESHAEADNFDNPNSPSYYFTGEGHFID